MTTVSPQDRQKISDYFQGRAVGEFLERTRNAFYRLQTSSFVDADNAIADLRAALQGDRPRQGAYTFDEERLNVLRRDIVNSGADNRNFTRLDFSVFEMARLAAASHTGTSIRQANEPDLITEKLIELGVVPATPRGPGPRPQ